MKRPKIDQNYIESLPVGITNLDRGLYIRKREGRNPSWLFIYTVAKKRVELSIGLTKDVTFKQAQDAADRYRAMLSQGVDPLTSKREKKKALAAQVNAKEPTVYTVKKLIDDALPVITTAKLWRNAKHSAQWKSTLTSYAVPVIGSLDVNEVTRDDILDVLQPIWKEKNETASRLRGRLEAVFSYAIVTGKMRGQNPAVWKGNLDLFLPPPSRVKVVEHHESATVDETISLLNRWRPPASSTAFAITFGVLTCARVGEFVPARWDEIDMKERVWSCPASRRKDGKPYPHRVPLSDQVVELLRVMPRDTDYLFPGKGGKAHISRETPRAIVMKHLGHATMHGFRSTFRDWAAENGWDTVLAEKSLMHATGNAVEQAYQRSDLLEQRRPLLQAWADAVYPKHE